MNLVSIEGLSLGVAPVLTALGLSLLVGALLLWPFIFWVLPGPLGTVVAVVVTIVIGYVCLLLYYDLEESGWWKH